MRLSVIIPTTGRSSLEAAKASASAADEIIVIENRDGDHGYSARTRGMAQATGTHLAFLDDDDIYTDGAVELMRKVAGVRPAIFRMDHPRHGILWRTAKLEFGNVGTPMFLVPNVPEKLGVWEPHMAGLKEPGGDFTFISGCVEKMGAPVWRQEVICKVRPNVVRGIAIVTTWHNHPEFLDGYTAAIGLRGAHDQLIVIDDGSEPPLEFANVTLEENAGFAKANNLGLRLAKTEAVLFLNNDVVTCSPDWLEPIRTMLEPGVLVGAQLRYDRHGSVDGDPMPYLDGWCLAGMTEDLRELGGWDEDYEEPAYYGDNDLCFRARLAGFTLKEARTQIAHLRDTQPRLPPSPFVQQVTIRNKARFEARVRDALGAAV